MTSWSEMLRTINLHVDGRISSEDAGRQTRTATEIIRRLDDRPGVILADVVGMGKTFVALAVAASVATYDRHRRPVVVMVPPNLVQKWPRDFETFRERCLPSEQGQRLRCAAASSGVEFLKLLDDSEERSAHVIFLTHGAMDRAMTDPWLRLAVIRQAIYRRHENVELKRSLSRCLASLVWGLARFERKAAPYWETLLSSAPETWADTLRLSGVDMPEDPVPRHFVGTLERLDTTSIYEAVKMIPRRESPSYDDRVSAAGKEITSKINAFWPECLRSLRLKLPLLILDEAHHLKNGRTRLASLFYGGDAESDSEQIKAKGALGGVFERMLFLTATPFQLGHHELCAVIDRFDGINWKTTASPKMGRDRYKTDLLELRGKLDRAQSSALLFNEIWGRLKPSDLVVAGVAHTDVETWWPEVVNASDRSGPVRQAIESYGRVKADFAAAEAALRPWVIRHLRHEFIDPEQKTARRKLLPGAAIVSDSPTSTGGIAVEGPALLPFLLAARATLCRPDERPVFAEGLASSYEAFIHTREGKQSALDEDDATQPANEANARAEWYLDQLKHHLPLKAYHDSLSHPKVAATADRVVAAWRAGEKAVVFCHFIQTGYALRRAISGKIRDTIADEAAKKLGTTPNEAFERLEDIGLRFFDRESNARAAISERVDALLRPHGPLLEHSDVIQEVVRRFLRTPSFLVRFFPLETTQRVTPESILAAFEKNDSSGLNFSELLHHFFDFLAVKCSNLERTDILGAVRSMQTGGISDKDAKATFRPDELTHGTDLLLPNVRLVNGNTERDTRQRLMLTFNSPFFPEILIASAVMAEGVDLHRYCRYVVHHDLCWNPSTLEQRTGRVDRIGAKVETSRRPIHVYSPFLSATQDERQFRVVSDRERWFNIVMGSEYKDDAKSTEEQSQRILLPAQIAESLTFQLGLTSATSTS